MRAALTLFLLVISCWSVNAQKSFGTYEDTVLFYELIEHKIRKHQGITEKKEFKYSLTNGKAYINAPQGTWDSILVIAKRYDAIDANGYIDISSQSLSFQHCFLHARIPFRKLKLEGISIYGSEAPTTSIYEPWGQLKGYMPGSINVDSCVLFGELEIFKSLVDESEELLFGDIKIQNSKINSCRLTNIAAKNLVIEHCIIEQSDIDRVMSADRIVISSNQFGRPGSKHDPDRLFGADSVSWYPFFLYRSLNDFENDLLLENNEFFGWTDTMPIVIAGEMSELSTNNHHVSFSGRFSNLNLQSNVFNSSLEFFDADVSHSLFINGNKMNGSVSIAGLLFSEKRNSFHWGQLSGFKLASVIRSVSSTSSLFGTDYNYKYNEGVTPADIKDSLGYYALLSSYKALYDIYKKNNEMALANSCYAEMKKVETRYWKHLYQQDGRFENYFRWRLNDFLSYFTDYGTNPAKAVIKSIWVILLFSIFYLFFPSDWDVSNRSEMLSRWKELFNRNREKSLLSTLSFLLFTAFIHLLNALTLSLNAFTTLGFGDIPTHGAARYVTIVQGFIGWFLLTIFSVSLINQVLG
jgi:hypothetical protein